MLVSGSTISELPISSSKEMINRHNDEIFDIDLTISGQVLDITLNIQQFSVVTLTVE